MKIFTLFSAVVLMTCAGLFAQVNLNNGLVASYPFNGNANDESGNGNDGTVSIGHTNWGAGTPVLTTDRFGNAGRAYYFNEGGNIEVPYSTILNPASMSLSWWIYMEEQANNDYMISMSRWNCYKVNLQDINRVFFTTKVADPDNPGEFIYNDRDHDGDGLVDSTWYHLAVSFGGGHMKFYIDGLLVKDWDNVPNTSILDISGDPVNLTFGQDLPTDVYDADHNVDWGGFFKGKIDDIKIYNRVLTDAEALALYELPDVDLDYGLVATYPFNGNANDESGNGNDGTVSIGHTNWGAGTPVLTTDRFGNADKAYYFNEGGHIEVPYSTILNPASMSLSWWIYMEEQANNDYMISMSRWNCYKVNLQDINRVFFTTKVADPDNPGEFIYNDRDHDGDGLVDSTWYHLAVSFGDGHMKFYIDGVLVKDWDNVPNTSILDISGDPVNLTFGQDLPTDVYDADHNVDWGGFFKGKMDEIRIYNRVLTDAEVQDLSGIVVSTEELIAINRTFELLQNYPNPFSSSTTIEFTQKEQGLTTLKVFNAVGQEVATLISEKLMPGTYQYTWNAGNMSSGVYFYRLSVNGYAQTKKLFLLK